MDIMEKCYQFYSKPEFAQTLGYPTNPRTAQAMGFYPFFIPIEESEGTEVIIDNKKLIMIGSNNYLGLTTHPKVREAAIEAIKKYGTGCTGSRFLNGTLHMHLELEDRLAKFVGMEKSIVFSTGFQTNLGTITAIVGKDDVIISDKEVHASIIDAISLAKIQKRTNLRFYKHNDMKSLENILKRYSHDHGKLVVVDGVFSMGGDIAPLPEITRLCKKYNSRLMVDDAHAVGVLGEGRGTATHFNCIEDVDLIMGTFSKSFASTGGFIAGKEEVIHWIKHFARSFIFSASLTPANTAAVLAVLDVIEEEPERVQKVNQIAETMRNELKALGFNIGESQTPIIPIIIGDQFKTMQAWRFLFDAGVYTNVAIPPAVPPHLSLLRTSYMASHKQENLDKILNAFMLMKDKLPGVTG
jgi:8-amino-7-oxononanoate synthase